MAEPIDSAFHVEGNEKQIVFESITIGVEGQARDYCCLYPAR